MLRDNVTEKKSKKCRCRCQIHLYLSRAQRGCQVRRCPLLQLNTVACVRGVVRETGCKSRATIQPSDHCWVITCKTPSSEKHRELLAHCALITVMTVHLEESLLLGSHVYTLHIQEIRLPFTSLSMYIHRWRQKYSWKHGARQVNKIFEYEDMMLFIITTLLHVYSPKTFHPGFRT